MGCRTAGQAAPQPALPPTVAAQSPNTNGLQERVRIIAGADRPAGLLGGRRERERPPGLVEDELRPLAPREVARRRRVVAGISVAEWRAAAGGGLLTARLAVPDRRVVRVDVAERPRLALVRREEVAWREVARFFTGCPV